MPAYGSGNPNRSTASGEDHVPDTAVIPSYGSRRWKPLSSGSYSTEVNVSAPSGARTDSVVHGPPGSAIRDAAGSGENASTSGGGVKNHVPRPGCPPPDAPRLTGSFGS